MNDSRQEGALGKEKTMAENAKLRPVIERMLQKKRNAKASFSFFHFFAGT